MEEVNNTTVDVEAFNNFFGITENAEESTADADTTDAADTDADNASSEEGHDDEGNNQTNDSSTDQTDSEKDGDDSQPDKAEPQKTNDQKSANAFAQLRIQNRQQQQTLQRIASVLGIPNAKDDNSLLEALNAKVIEAQSKQQNIPVELLQRLQMLESRDAAYARQQALLAAGKGFQDIKDKFNLDNDALESFAQELINDGINPYEKPVDLLQLYQSRHFDELMEAAVAKGIRTESERAAKALNQSSKPNKQKGAEPETQDKINTVADLEKWLAENAT